MIRCTSRFVPVVVNFGGLLVRRHVPSPRTEANFLQRKRLQVTCITENISCKIRASLSLYRMPNGMAVNNYFRTNS